MREDVMPATSSSRPYSLSARRAFRLLLRSMALRVAILCCVVGAAGCFSEAGREAAFQGECDHENLCEQLCYELHDGMFECDCRDGFVLHTNGYSCSLINTTSLLEGEFEPKFDDREDIIYQKDASFSAVLDTRRDNKISINTFELSSKSISSTTSSTTLPINDTAGKEACTMFCGIGVCIMEYDESDVTKASQRCQCILGRAGTNCETDVEIRVPRFSGRGWLAFPALRAAYKHVQLEIEFRPEQWDGILLLTGERDDLAGDFVSVLLHHGFIEFRFDCGSGVGVIRSEEAVLLNKWNKLKIYRHRWDAWIQLNKGKKVRGRSKGLFSRITFREPVFVGGRGNTSLITDKIPTDKGFIGCVRYLEINGVMYNFAAAPLGDALSGFDVVECSTDRCSHVPCKHGGKCIIADDEAVCICPIGFTGDLCETSLDFQVPFFNGSSFLRHSSIDSRFRYSLSWLDIEIIMKPKKQDGIILYSGQANVGLDDSIALYLSTGYVVFTFNMGSGSATVRSANQITMDEWHTIKISRTGRLGVLQVDKHSPEEATSPGAFVQLSLIYPLWIGGVPNFESISPDVITISDFFAGCIQKIMINNQLLKILSEAQVGVNVGNCAHPCLGKPCGQEENLHCEPIFDTYKCVCDKSCQQHYDNSVQRSSSVATFNDDGFLHYTDPEINKRLGTDSVTMNIRFKTTTDTGLILWYGNTDTNSNFLSLGIKRGYLQLRFDSDDGETSVMYNTTKINDGHWHRVNIFREKTYGSIAIDNGDPIMQKTEERFLYTKPNSGLYIGGVENIVETTRYEYSRGIKGCISDFVLNSDYHLHLTRKSEDGATCD